MVHFVTSPRIYFSVVVVITSILISYFFTLGTRRTGLPMATTGLLFVSNAAKTHNLFLKASQHVKKVLYIKVKNPETTLSTFSKQIVSIYTKSTTHSGNLDVRFILNSTENTKKITTNYQVDVILYDRVLDKDTEHLKSSILTLGSHCQLKCIVCDHLDFEESDHKEDIQEESVQQYDYVALGGTFDRLHNGHKIFLSQAALRTKKQLTVAVTDINMIQSKKLWELIEPIEKRMESVLNFLTDVNPYIEYNVIPLRDFFGPTKDDPKLQMLIVSKETASGGIKINEKRKENNLPPMDVYTVDLVQESQQFEEEEEKVSSSNRRMRLLGTMLRTPEPNPDIPDWPYVLGLAGGIASGKSKIAERLQAKGAGLVNCDTLAHDLYKPGLPLNATIADTFGNHLVTESGEIDRRQLGEIVFGNKAEMEKLNKIMWPAILEEVERRVSALGRDGRRVVVVEAAVMVRARWYERCHQLWAVLVPPNEAVKRIQERNKLSEEEAWKRVSAQPSNSEQVKYAHVVFSPYWSYDHTQGQVDRAWEHLMAYLDTRK